ncbi:hypothetical protein [Streptococcus suis]|uniref:hypothetical protein n=1 Tax=Streptococcus suis TaxID=1307 RepID=UPI000419CC83|nr:hypothetical protein [Streptococcus suis]HEM3170577.1 hypothetical protein [Streptococcus suis]
MIDKFTKHFSQTQNSVIDEIDKFQKRLHGTSIAALAGMDLGILPKDKMAGEKALLSHEISHALKDILNGMTAEEALNKMVDKARQEED